MGLFNRKKKAAAKAEPKVEVRLEMAEEERTSFEESLAALRLLEECHADAQYQAGYERYMRLMSYVREMYSVINSVGSFSSEAGDRLIAACADAIEVEASIKEKMEYYQNTTLEMSESRKTLAMIYEKRGDYERAANICAFAIRSGFTADGTAGGMRGRLARMIKKGNLPLTDAYKEVLGL